MDTNIMNWDDVIENDGQEYILLPEGDYTFAVTGCERGQFPGGQKLSACPKVTVTLLVETEQGTAATKVDLMLHRNVEWKLAAFFRSIGMKKHGEPCRMDFYGAVGRRGRAHFKPRTYLKDGQERQVNDVDHFIDYDFGGFPTQGCRPFSAENCPPDSFPGATNPPKPFETNGSAHFGDHSFSGFENGGR